MSDTNTQSLADRIRGANRGRINISFIYPPIPLRQFDWCATFADDEPDDNGNMLAGFGATEAEALTDLLDNLDMLP